MSLLESSDEAVLGEMRKLRELYKLKTTLRYQTVRDGAVHSESVAEHLFGMQVLAEYFLPLEDPEGKLNRLRIYQLMLYHEIGEVETGDIVFDRKNEELRAVERQAAVRVAERLPTSLGKVALACFREFEECVTPESVFADAIDKGEPIFELYDDINLRSFKRLNIRQDVATASKLEATKTFPYMRRCIDAWLSYAISREAFPA